MAFADDHEELLAWLRASLPDRLRSAQGCLHEYVHRDIGRGLNHPGFVNRNACACLMLPELREGGDATAWREEGEGVDRLSTT